MDLKSRPHIVFNGTGTCGGDYFMINSGPVTETQSVDTEGKPYDLLVCATLILADYLCPDTWEISSTAPEAARKDGLELARAYISDASLPAGVQSAFGDPVPAPVPVSVPVSMDFRG